MAITRRSLITRVAQAGGYRAAFSMMQTLGLMPMAESAVSVPDLPAGSGKGTRVAILGGGMAGLVAAYELGKAGFNCTLLEARERPGGRAWTIRKGSTVEFTDGTKQTADWESENYFNAGPGRIPSIHRTILNYCKQLGVALECEINSSRSTLLVNDKAFGGKAVENRQAINDTRGHVAELLAKCIRQNALDQELSKDDRDRMLTFLRTYGDLRQDLTYKGSSRAGASHIGGAGNITEELRPPLDMNALLDAGFWNGMLFEESLDYQATMLQPVGGMDRIPYAFARKLGHVIRYGSPVKEIRKTTRGVRVVYKQGAAEKTLEADYCICTIPAGVLKTTANDFSPRIRQAIEDTSYSDAYKIGWESKRFWETDFNIYGGISWLTGDPITLIWYPSSKLLSDTGILLGGYATERGSAFGRLPSIEAKLAASRAAIEKLHPGCSKYLTKPIYVNWGKIPYQLGSWMGGGRANAAGGRPVSYYDGPYQEFLRPDDRIYFAGDHISHISAWIEGAVLSAHRVINMIGERVRTA